MDLFQPDDIIEIVIASGDFKGTYSSKVINAESNEMLVTAPKITNNLVPFEKNAIFTATLLKKDAMYEFQTKVLSAPAANFAYLTLLLPQVVKRKQRRADFRIAVKIPVELLYFYRNDDPVAAATVNSVDLSAGGVRIESSDSFPVGKKYKMALILRSEEETEEITLEAEVVRSEAIDRPEPGSPNLYWTAFKFINVSESKKKKILKFIYKQQELRLKGLI